MSKRESRQTIARLLKVIIFGSLAIALVPANATSNLKSVKEKWVARSVEAKKRIDILLKDKGSVKEKILTREEICELAKEMAYVMAGDPKYEKETWEDYSENKQFVVKVLIAELPDKEEIKAQINFTYDYGQSTPKYAHVMNLKEGVTNTIVRDVAGGVLIKTKNCVFGFVLENPLKGL